MQRVSSSQLVLLAAVHTLDNTLRAVISKLNLFDASWSPERRDQLILEINAFANQEQILPILRVYTDQLEMYLREAQYVDQGETQEILQCARGTLAALGDSPVTPFPDTYALRLFLQDIKDARTTDDVVSVIQQSDTALKVVERDVLAKADQAFGRLKGQILSRYKALPDPGWSTTLPAKS
jgi:hypothetical protein